ncbi:MAG: hypothetical protein CBD97_03500 [Pelagibacteraceae bacterium TMED237]|nr:MAG: hypothetical protein CBD97_03500 [Pelagibacteraceae bacterium TMED237]
MDLNTLINNNKNQFDKKFKQLLIDKLDNSILSKAMFYGCNNGGKRIRPFLAKQASKIVGISNHDSFIISASIELIHSYSLIHDDLPAMDNDDYRRGKLSTHKKFDEATAILAGDALHDLAFTLLSGNLKNKNLKNKLSLINYLALCIGHKGLAMGQSLDLEFENKNIKKNKILNMYLNKTGKLFEFSFCAPFILANRTQLQIEFAKEYGLLFGLIFQIIDDIIDEVGTLENIGKTPGKDIKQGKSTLISILGRNNAIEICKNKIKKFKTKHKIFINKNIILDQLLDFSLKRIN